MSHKKFEGYTKDTFRSARKFWIKTGMTVQKNKFCYSCLSPLYWNELGVRNRAFRCLNCGKIYDKKDSHILRRV